MYIIYVTKTPISDQLMRELPPSLTRIMQVFLENIGRVKNNPAGPNMIWLIAGLHFLMMVKPAVMTEISYVYVIPTYNNKGEILFFFLIL